MNHNTPWILWTRLSESLPMFWSPSAPQLLMSPQKHLNLWILCVGFSFHFQLPLCFERFCFFQLSLCSSQLLLCFIQLLFCFVQFPLYFIQFTLCFVRFSSTYFVFWLLLQCFLFVCVFLSCFASQGHCSKQTIKYCSAEKEEKTPSKNRVKWCFEDRIKAQKCHNSAAFLPNFYEFLFLTL